MRIIEVIPNPYAGLDKDGVPQAAVGAGMPGAFIGAQIDLVATLATGKNRFYFPPNRDGSLTRKVHLTGDMMTAIHAGDLLVANKADAAAVGLVAFLEPAAALEAERVKALARWQALRGPDAKLGDIPREATKVKDGEEPPAQPATKQITPTLKMSKNTEA